MKFTPYKINLFLLFKLPAAYFSGVRLKKIENNRAVTTVKHQWINQNPFRSIYFAVQCMASELSTGILVMKKIQQTNRKVSMLVTRQEASFAKKAIGRIYFTCPDGEKIDKALSQALVTGKGQTFELASVGINEKGEQVSSFLYQWSVKVKSSK